MPKLTLSQTHKFAQNPAYLKGLSYTYKSDREAAKALGISQAALKRLTQKWVMFRSTGGQNEPSDRELLALQKSLSKLDKSRQETAAAFPRFTELSKLTRFGVEKNLRKSTQTEAGQRGFREQMRKYHDVGKISSINYKRLFGYPASKPARSRHPKRARSLRGKTHGRRSKNR